MRQALAAALPPDAGVPAVVAARASAQLLDDRYSPSFAESFRRRSAYQPGVGDPVPLDSPDLPQVTALSATSPPWRLANTLRACAVLVLLTESPIGPAMLLTERAHDLRQYPGQLVFPGGAADPGDDGAVGTALREAAEETGLEPTSVHVLGTLPALALFDSGFLLTPVLAWSPLPHFTASANLGEVLSVSTMPLAPRRVQKGPASYAVNPSETANMDASPARLGPVTALVIDLLAGMLGHLDSLATRDAIPVELLVHASPIGHADERAPTHATPG